MPSDTAAERALRRGPGFKGFLLAHHWPPELNRCYQGWIRNKPVWICARCLGLYPLLLLFLGIQFWMNITPGWWDVLWLYLLPLPALLDWGSGFWKEKQGSNRQRTLTGALLGVSLSRMIFLHMVNPFSFPVVIQWIELGCMVLLIAVIGMCRRKREAHQERAAPCAR
jgi:uncharacterized membrane protein